MFTPGQHVVFVGADPSCGPVISVTQEGSSPATLILSKGSVYTVAEVYPAGWQPWAGATVTKVLVGLEEHPGLAFLADWFRPISRTSTEIVESLMAPVKAPGKVPEPA